jgi:hypothetical protein
MTNGLLISRSNKLKLQKLAVNSRLPIDINKFRQYRNIFNGLVRASKKMYFEQNLHIYKRNPKKTWDLLKEATNLTKNACKIDKLKINGQTSDNPAEMANAFNEFFSSIGTEISNLTHLVILVMMKT